MLLKWSRDLAVSLETPDHNHCRTPSKFFECGGRFAVSKQQGPIRIETLPKRRGTLKVVLFASRLPHQLPQYFVENPTLAVRGQMPYDRFGEIIFFMHFPHFTLFYKSWRKWVTTQQENVACHTNLAVSNLVTPSARYVYSSSTATSKEHKLNKPTRGSSSSNCKQNITPRGVDHIRELLKKGVSETAAQLITSTRQVKVKVDSQITIHPEECRVAGVINKRLMHFDVR